MFDERGQLVQAAGPSTPVEVIGWRELPNAGEAIFQVSTEVLLHDFLFSLFFCWMHLYD